MAKIPPGVGPRFPQVVVLFGATGDLARRKLLPGYFDTAPDHLPPALQAWLQPAASGRDVRPLSTARGAR